MAALGDISRSPSRFPIATAAIIALNAPAFMLELIEGDAFVTRWALVPADIFVGRHLITILTSMFMHASWSHIIGNMVFLSAFDPQIEDAMGPTAVLCNGSSPSAPDLSGSGADGLKQHH